MPDSGTKLVASNRKARHDYTILDTYEAGIALTGTEVKSLRAGRASLVDGFATVSDDELWLRNVHIARVSTPPVLDDYINGYIARSVDAVAKNAGVPKINLLGICQGGAFSLCFTAMHPHKVKNLITMVTPVDFHTPDNMLSHWMRGVDTDLFVDTLGNVPADTTSCRQSRNSLVCIMHGGRNLFSIPLVTRAYTLAVSARSMRDRHPLLGQS